ncbi:MAG: signal peptidase I [Candidatus Sericytochromatia bacterium]|nr:signal peptidase I [Candidatus Sericytochromatia bacterium]
MTDKTYQVPPPENDERITDSMGGPPSGLPRAKSKTREYIETLVIAFILAIVVRTTIAEARYIPSESMLPTLEVGDRLIVEKMTYRFAPVERGDIVVFEAPPRAMGNGNAFIKRVVGLPGERIDIRGGQVYINGDALKEPYILEAPRYPDPDWEALGLPEGRIPADSLFVMGDNRNNSQDSHVWGSLPLRNVIGQTVFRFWPPTRLGIIPS